MLNANWKETIEDMVEEQKKYPNSYSKNPLDDILDEDWDEEDYMFDIDGYNSNMACDNSGICAGPSCPRYFKCQ